MPANNPVTPKAMTTAYIGLGANLGNPQQMLRQTIAKLAQLPQLSLLAQSSLYRSAPIDSSGPEYINAVIAVTTNLTASQLLDILQQLELDAGRTRPFHNAPRLLDLDLLFFGEQQIDTPSLTVPHPRWQQRAFVLLPLQEIAPDLVTEQQLSVVKNQHICRITALPSN